jgi:hypothetical protein
MINATQTDPPTKPTLTSARSTRTLAARLVVLRARVSWIDDEAATIIAELRRRSTTQSIAALMAVGLDADGHTMAEFGSCP